MVKYGIAVANLDCFGSTELVTMTVTVTDPDFSFFFLN